MKPSRRNRSQPPSSTGSVDKDDDGPSRMPGMHIDYDEARSYEERRTYHQPLHLPFEFLMDVHPITRLKSRRRDKGSH